MLRAGSQMTVSNHRRGWLLLAQALSRRTCATRINCHLIASSPTEREVSCSSTSGREGFSRRSKLEPTARRRCSLSIAGVCPSGRAVSNLPPGVDLCAFATEPSLSRMRRFRTGAFRFRRDGTMLPSTLLPPPEAFNPRRDDTTGLSISRARYKTAEEAARGPSAQGYYVALLQAGRLRAAGIEVVPRPLPGDPGHSELPGLTYDQRKSDQAREQMVQLAHALTFDVQGPFRPPSASGSASE